MPRAVWSGAISFGLVNIPVKLFTAASSKTVRFNQIDRRTGSRVRQRLVAEADGREVERSDIAKGYQISPGDYVLLDDSELAALDPKAEHTIDIEEFVDLDQIDPLYFDRPYWLAPDPATVKPYALLATTMAEANKVAIARFVMRSRQQLAAIRSVDGRLVMSTMNWDDELVAPDELPGFDALDEVEVSEREQALADQLIATLSTDWTPAKYSDTHREQVLALIERKASGAEIVTTADSTGPGGEVVDLMAALEASVNARRQAKGRHPSATDAAAETEAGAAAEAGSTAGTTTRKSAAKTTRSRASSRSSPKKSAAQDKPAAKKGRGSKTAAKAPTRKSA